MQRFACPTCEKTDFEQIAVRLPSGLLRQTDLFCCKKCRAVFYDPTKYTAADPAGEERVPDLTRYGKTRHGSDGGK